MDIRALNPDIGFKPNFIVGEFYNRLVKPEGANNKGPSPDVGLGPECMRGVLLN